MATDNKQKLNEMNQGMGALGKAIPGVMGAFGNLHKEFAGKDGALDVKTKELIGVAISVTVRCEDCIAAHTMGAVKAGASREEFAEALGVAIGLQGGPGVAYAIKALHAYDDLSS
jgi:AhpD family alkylhydroperoxidase